MSRSDAVTFQRKTLLREAAQWLSRLDEGQLTAVDLTKLQQWREKSAEHERVWMAACELRRDLSTVPATIAEPVLRRPRENRRLLLKGLLGAGLTLPLGWQAFEQKPWQLWLAEYKTVAGEFLSATLSDGTTLLLNTSTALDVIFSQDERLIRLHSGEVLVRTGPDQESADRVRPLSLVTDQGSVWTLGSEFAARCLAEMTLVTVATESVRATPQLALQDGRTVLQGQQCRFTRDAVVAVAATPRDYLAWQRGQLVASETPLRGFLAELNRYHSGILRCDEAIATLKVSGVFQLNNVDQALDVLAQVLHLRLHRYTDYWIQLSAA